MGLFYPFVNDQDVAMYGAEAAGRGLEGLQHAASLSAGRIGVLHGSRTYLLDDDDGQILDTHSVSAGLDYPGVAPSTPGSRTAAAPAITGSPTRRRWPHSTS